LRDRVVFIHKEFEDRITRLRFLRRCDCHWTLRGVIISCTVGCSRKLGQISTNCVYCL